MSRAPTLDCAILGTCTVDILVKPIDLQQPLGPDRLLPVEPISVSTGGLVSNAGLALARLGNSVSAITGVGDDDWGEIIRQRLGAGGVDVSGVQSISGQGTSATVVLIDPAGQRSFAHCPGACAAIDPQFWARQESHLSSARFLLLGYYSLLPALESELPSLLPALKKRGTRIALDSAGSGGDPVPLKSILPWLDVYFPSRSEVEAQTGVVDPAHGIEVFRTWGARGLLGVKLGPEGVLVSSRAGDLVHLPALRPPGPIVDTTGAGDAFFAGLLSGLLDEQPPIEAARRGLAVAAYSITGLGASSVLPSRDEALGWAQAASAANII